MSTALRELQVERQWDPTPEILQRLLDHKTRLYDDFDSVPLREWVVEWYHRLQPQFPPTFLKFPDQFWQLVAEDKSLEPSRKKMRKEAVEYKMLKLPLHEYTFRILGFKRKDEAQDDAPPPRDTPPAKVLDAGEWYPRFCQYTAFQKVRNDPSAWAGLDVWVEVHVRRVDICDKEVERRCNNQRQRVARIVSKPEDQEKALATYEQKLNSLLNGRLTAVYKFPDYRMNRRRQWSHA